jgi:Co/Zn/Cd efflux system component
MIPLPPWQMMLIGFLLLVIGVVLPFAMILKLIEPTLLLGFVAYLASFMGLVMGLVGVILHTAGQRRNRD